MLKRILHAVAVVYEGLVNVLALTTSEKANQFRDEIFAQLDAVKDKDSETIEGPSDVVLDPPITRKEYKGIDAYSIAIVRLYYKRPMFIFLYLGIWLYWLTLIVRLLVSLFHR